MAFLDRTAEFQRLVELHASESQKGAGSSTHVSTASRHGLPAATPAAPLSSRFPAQDVAAQEEFTAAATTIDRDLSNVSVRLFELSRLVRKKGIFEDRTAEIQEMTASINQTLTGLSNSVDKLEGRLSQQSAYQQSHHCAHNKAMASSLRNQLLEQVKRFKDVLEQRAQTMRSQDARRNLYSHSGTANAASSSSSSSSTTVPSFMRSDPHMLETGGSQFSNDPSDLESGKLIPSGHQQQLQMQRAAGNLYTTARAEAVESVQRMIGDLAQIFGKVATMVTQQEEMVLRIDEDVDSSLHHLREGQSHLLKYLRYVTSNRMLIMKIFAILISFVVFFVVFLI